MGDSSSVLFLFKMSPSTELLERCRKDDRRAHYELYKLCFGFIMAICRRYYVNREDMESSLNQIFVKMVKNMSSYLRKQDHIPFDLWVRRVSINHVVDEFRKNKKYREQMDLREISESEEFQSAVHPQFESEQMEVIYEAIEQLSDMNRAVFNLFYVDGYGHDEIAAMLKISPGTSKVHLHRAKKRLRELLEVDKQKNNFIDQTIFQ
jgi:RNA polymerase sigma factor (sigma-70 family)